MACGEGGTLLGKGGGCRNSLRGGKRNHRPVLLRSFVRFISIVMDLSRR